MKENHFIVLFIIIFSGYKTRSNEIRFHGSSSYIDIGKPFTFVCSSDNNSTGETTTFFLNQNKYITLRYITSVSACYALSPTNVPPPYKCTDTCSCTPSNFTLTYTRNNTGNNYVVLFGCEMTFGLTNISKTLNVPVAHGPLSVDLNSPSHVWITESEQLSPIQCTADCVPNCTYTWNGSGRTFNGSLLEFSSVQKSQNGTYTCTASNSYGSNTTTVNILVQYAPLEITINPVNTSFDVVEAYQLGPVSCNATCYPECEIRWTGPRYSVTSYRLVIDTITRNQKGIFTCTANNRVGSLTKEIQVNVLYGPSIVSLYPTMANVIVNENGQLGPINCSSDCEPQCSYRWTGPGFYQSSSSLLIRDTQRNQNGTYMCIASNKYGQNTTNINVFVHYAPLEITINPVNTSFDVVEAFQLGPVSCNATCYPECEIRWTGPRYSVTSYRLVIDTITRNQKGIFTCTANNRVGSLTKEIQVNVLYGPSIVSLYPSMANVIVNENGQLGPINCSSDCEPQCSYRWTGPGFYQSSSSLLIRDTQRNQNGTYMCIASNKYGQNTTNINVFVHYAPLEITINPVNTSFDVVEAYQLGPVSCNATCYPECEIQWTGPGYNVTSYRLVIDTITRNQKGIFICTAKNRVGSLTKEMQVNVLYGPSIVLLSPSLAIVIVNESGQLGPINCSSDCEPQCLYRWTGPGFNQSTSSLLIRDTQRNQNGSYMCIAFNKFGQRTISVNVIVHFGPNNIFLNPEISFYAAFDTLYVPALTRSQSGFFECTTSNIIGHMTKKIEVAVQYQPSNMSLQILGNATVFENQTAVFQCDVDSNPKSNLTWVFKPTGQILKADAFTQSSNFRIMVANCLHTGIYQCTASNQIGVVTYTSSQVTAFQVLCSVRVDNTRSDQTNTTVRLTLNDSLNLYVYIIAYPKPSITWTFTNKETHHNRTLQGSNTFGISNHTSAIQLDKLDIHGFGYYTFEASNGIGDGFVRVFSVIHKQKPPIPNFVLLICKARSAILLWKSEIDVTQMFLVQYKRSKESKYSYTAEVSNKNLGEDVVFTIDELLPATQYEFLVISRNDVGDSVSELQLCSTDAEQNDQRASNGLSTTSIAVFVVGISVALFAPLIACFYIRRKTKKLYNSQRYTEFKTFSSPEKSEYDIIGEVVEESEQKKEDTYDNVNL